MHSRSVATAFLLLILATGSVTAQEERTGTSNFVNCLSGNSFACNRDQLSDAQRDEVRQAELRRNFVNCRSGNSFACNRDQLSDAQRDEVRQAELRRNFVNCRSGNSFACNQDQLSDAQRDEVRQAELRRNFVNCRSGNSFACNQGQLTEAQRALATAGSEPAARVLKPQCAENGSCYGDISAATGRPKTVYVGGYYRRDGTYVRGHYRSRPRR